MTTLHSIFMTLTSLALFGVLFFLFIFGAPLLIDLGMNSWIAAAISVVLFFSLLFGFMPVMDAIDATTLWLARKIKAVTLNFKRSGSQNGLIIFGLIYFLVIGSFALQSLTSLYTLKQFLPWATLFIGLGIPLFPSLMLSYLNEQTESAYERGLTYGYQNGRKRGEDYANRKHDVLSYNDESLELVSRRSKIQHKQLKAQQEGIDSLISKLSTLKASQHKNPAFPLELIKEIQSELHALKGLK